MKPKPTPHPALARAIVIEGNQRNLAIALGVGSATVTHWIHRGLPTDREAQLVKLYGRRKLPKTWGLVK